MFINSRLMKNENNCFSLSPFLLSLKYFLWLGSQFPQEKFLILWLIFISSANRKLKQKRIGWLFVMVQSYGFIISILNFQIFLMLQDSECCLLTFFQAKPRMRKVRIKCLLVYKNSLKRLTVVQLSVNNMSVCACDYHFQSTPSNPNINRMIFNS